MPLKNPRGDLFRDRPVSVSLNALRPGVNHVVVEAQTPDAGDQACEVKHLMDVRKRFVLFDRSELVRSRLRPHRQPAQPCGDLLGRLSLDQSETN